MLIPFQKSSTRQTPKVPTAAPQSPSTLTNVRLKEIVPLYQDVTIRCAVGAYLAAAPAIHSAEDVVGLFGFLEYETRETLFALHLNCKNEILCLDQVSIGSLTASIVHPREVYKSALLSSAAALVFVHNHPSGDPKPSPEDYKLQARLVEAGELLGIKVLDHVIVGSRGRHISLASHSLNAQGEALSAEQGDPLFV